MQLELIIRSIMVAIIIIIAICYVLFLQRRRSAQDKVTLPSFELRQGKVWLIFGFIFMFAPLSQTFMLVWEVILSRAFDPTILPLIFVYLIPGAFFFLFYFRWRIVVHTDRLDIRPVLGPQKTYHFWELGRIRISETQPDPELNITLYTEAGKRLFRTNVRKHGYWVLIERIAPYVENPEALPRRAPTENTQQPNYPQPPNYPPASIGRQ